MAAMQLTVLGSLDALSFEVISVNEASGLVTIDISGPDGAARVCLTPDRTDDLINMLRENRRAAAGDDEPGEEPF